MKDSGRRAVMALLPLLLLGTACTDPVVFVEEAAEVETCERLVPVGIELVSDYVYTLEETDLGPTGGDPAKLPESLRALNLRGEDLDRRAAELGCDLAALNGAIAEATAGLESSDLEAQVLLEAVRSGVVSATPDDLVGEWAFVEGTNGGAAVGPAPGQTITLVFDESGVGSGFTGCNEYDVVGVATAGLWPIEGYEQTAAPCPSDAETAAEDAYTTAIQLITEYAVEGNQLILNGPGVEMRFNRQVSPNSAGESTQP
jgi:heat shock protein HslJ